MPEFVRVAALGEVPEGGVRAFDLPWGRLAIARVDQEVHAIGDECTHASCSLSEGALSSDEAAVECPCHGATFDLASGEPLDGPAVDPVPVHPVRAREGWIEVAAPETP